MGLAAEAVASAGLRLSGITLKRRGTMVLDGLALSVAATRLTVVVGSPACNLAALFDVLAGFERAQGAILLDGRDITRCSSQRRGLGVVRQSDRLFPHLSLAQNVAFPLRVRGMPLAQRRILAADMLDMVQIGRATGERLPARASRAERQRTLLARAAVFAPRLLLLDDPFSDQDAASRTALIAGLHQIHTLSGAVSLLFSRNAAEALAVADDVAVMRRGAVVQHGSVQDVFDHPQDAGVATLLGETNILGGHVEAVEEDVASIRLACGPVVEARPDMALRPGDPCLLVLRPDRIALAAIPAAEMGDAAIDAMVIGAEFTGETYRLRLLVGSGAELVVRRPVAAGLRGMAAGSAISVAWQPHHAWAFPAPTLDGRRLMADS